MTSPPGPPPARSRGLLAYPAYGRLWLSTSVSMVGTYVTVVALQLLATVHLHATATEIGVLSGAQRLPYLVFGLLAGVLIDRVRRRPVLVASDLLRAAVLTVIPVSTLLGVLSIPGLVVLVFVFGALSLLYDAAYQSYPPRLLPPDLLVRGNARLEQSSNVAQTGGPLIAGVLVKAIGAPFAVLVDALSYLVSGFVVLTLPSVEPPRRRERGNLGRELREGIAHVYRHPHLGPLAFWTHAWFLVNCMVTAVYVPYVVRVLGLGPFGLGVTLAGGGAAGVLGGALASRAVRRFGVVPPILTERYLVPVAWALLPLAPAGPVGWVMAGAAQALFGFAISLSSPAELGYRQAVTPDRLQGRTNATIKSLNWGMLAIGAPLGGVLADALGYRIGFWIPVAGLVVVAVGLHVSGFRRARTPTEMTAGV